MGMQPPVLERLASGPLFRVHSGLESGDESDNSETGSGLRGLASPRARNSRLRIFLPAAPRPSSAVSSPRGCDGPCSISRQSSTSAAANSAAAPPPAPPPQPAAPAAACSSAPPSSARQALRAATAGTYQPYTPPPTSPRHTAMRKQAKALLSGARTSHTGAPPSPAPPSSGSPLIVRSFVRPGSAVPYSPTHQLQQASAPRGLHQRLRRASVPEVLLLQSDQDPFQGETIVHLSAHAHQQLGPSASCYSSTPASGTCGSRGPCQTARITAAARCGVSSNSARVSSTGCAQEIRSVPGSPVVRTAARAAAQGSPSPVAAATVAAAVAARAQSLAMQTGATAANEVGPADVGADLESASEIATAPDWIPVRGEDPADEYVVADGQGMVVSGSSSTTMHVGRLTGEAVASYTGSSAQIGPGGLLSPVGRPGDPPCVSAPPSPTRPAAGPGAAGGGGGTSALASPRAALLQQQHQHLLCPQAPLSFTAGMGPAVTRMLQQRQQLVSDFHTPSSPTNLITTNTTNHNFTAPTAARQSTGGGPFSPSRLHPRPASAIPSSSTSQLKPRPASAARGRASTCGTAGPTAATTAVGVLNSPRAIAAAAAAAAASVAAGSRIAHILPEAPSSPLAMCGGGYTGQHQGNGATGSGGLANRLGRVVASVMPSGNPGTFSLSLNERIDLVLMEAGTRDPPSPSPPPPNEAVGVVKSVLQNRREAEVQRAAVGSAFSSPNPARWMHQALLEQHATAARRASNAHNPYAQQQYQHQYEHQHHQLSPWSPPTHGAPAQQQHQYSPRGLGVDSWAPAWGEQEGGYPGVGVGVGVGGAAAGGPVVVPRHTSAEGVHLTSVSYQASREASRVLGANTKPGGKMSLRDATSGVGYGGRGVQSPRRW